MFLFVAIVAIVVFFVINEIKYKKLETAVLKELGFLNWNIVSKIDKNVTVKSRQSLEKYDSIKFFKNDEKFSQVKIAFKRKKK